MNILKFENRLSQATEYTKIKLCIDNLVATFGEDIVKAVIMADLSLTDKDGYKFVQDLTFNELDEVK